MYVDLGTVRPGTSLFVPFHTFDSNDPSASVTITGLATTDIEVYKDASMTQRASDSGYALVDTDGIDIDTTTGIHGVTIDLADNTTAGFWAAGSDYVVVIASITVDAATINFIPIRFRIGYAGAVLNTTIATLSTQTSFTLTSGPAEDDALNGMWCWIHDVASAVQCGYAVISDYTGSTKTVTLAAGTTFTAAATDNISIMGPMPLQPTTAGNKLDVTATGAAGIDWGNVENPTTAVDLAGTDIQLCDTTTTVTNQVTADVTAISGDSVAADNLESEYDGTGYKSYLRRATAQAGGASSITLDASASATNSLYNGLRVAILSGTGAGQSRVITAYTGSTKVATVTPSWTTNPASGSVFALFPAHVNVAAWRLSQPNTLASGLVTVDVTALSGDATAANNAESFFDGTGYAGTNNVIPTVTAVTNQVTANTTSIEGADATDTINAQVDAAIETYNLHYILHTALPTNWTTDITANSALDYMADDGTATFDRTTESLQALRDHVGDGTNLTEAGGDGDHLTNITVAALGTTAKSDVNAEVDTALATTTYAEPGSVPAATASLKDKIGWLFVLARNKITSTSTTQTLRNDADSADVATSTHSDDGTTYTRGEWT